MRKFFPIIFLLTLWISFLRADEKAVLIDSIFVRDGNIVIDFHTSGIFDEKTTRGLQRGLTSTFQYEVQLWEKRSRWVNGLITSETRRIKVFFDNWEKKYVILSPEEKRLTSSLETVKRMCTQIKNVHLIPSRKIDTKKKYFIAVKAVLKPLSMRNYQEIKNWLSGSAKNLDLKNLDDSEEQERRLKGGFLKLLLSLTGFGDKVVSGKSKIFYLKEGKIIFE